MLMVDAIKLSLRLPEWAPLFIDRCDVHRDTTRDSFEARPGRAARAIILLGILKLFIF